MRKALWIILAALIMAIGAPNAHADTITYTFTGAGVFAGTEFTYVSTGGFLANGAIVVPTTATDLILSGTAEVFGAIEFLDPNDIAFLVNPSSGGFCCANIVYDISATGTYTSTPFGGQESGTLVISDNSAAVPEPATSILMLTGIGLVLVMRNRLA